MRDVVKYLFEAGQLKRVRRSGWWIAGVENPESVAEHSFRAAVTGYMIGKMEGLDADKVAIICLFHDMPEARINDLHKVGQRYINTKESDEKAFLEQIAPLPDKIKKDLLKSMHFKNDDSTPEQVAARDADLVEAGLQAKEYLERGYKEAQDWINNIKKIVKTKTAVEMVRLIETMDSSSWWKGLKKIER